MKAVGSANGYFTLNECISSSEKAVLEILKDLNLSSKNYKIPTIKKEILETDTFWFVEYGSRKKFVDLQNDVTVKDIEIAYKENFESAAHSKRYTTLGMGTDQGKTSNTTGLAILASLSKKSIPEVGRTVYRPPFVPVSLDSFVGASFERIIDLLD